MIPLALLFIGFSVFSAIVIALTHFSAVRYADQSLSRLMGLFLLLALSALQLAHFVWLFYGLEWVARTPYHLFLYVVAPVFYLFSLPLLRPQSKSLFHPVMLVHFLPLLFVPLLPEGMALPLAFIVGAVYLLLLGKNLYALKSQRDNFRREMQLLGAVFAIAVTVSIIGFIQPILPEKWFYSLYSIAIGLAFFLVQMTLSVRPDLLSEVQETAVTAYASSTLSSVDCDAVLGQLTALMRTKKVYEDSDLSLSALANILVISPHQLSELINSKLGKGFSRYLREQRVSAACNLLCEEPTASVLSVGLSVGFTSQSNFYQAFREIEGTTPGKFRKLKSNS